MFSSEGKVTLNIENEADLMKRQKAGKPLKIKCEVVLENVSHTQLNQH